MKSKLCGIRSKMRQTNAIHFCRIKVNLFADHTMVFIMVHFSSVFTGQALAGASRESRIFPINFIPAGHPSL